MDRSGFLCRTDIEGEALHRLGTARNSDPDGDPAAEEEPLRPVYCAACGSTVTYAEFATEVGGSFEHVFTNPHGYVFRIGLYTHAPGTAPVGGWTEEFSWFAGCSWRYALCAACLTHLGWEFGGGLGPAAGTNVEFFGLVLPKLRGV